MKDKYIFGLVLVFTLVVIDVITTAIYLKLGFIEKNQLARLFYSFGFVGYLFFMLLTFMLLFSCFYIIEYFEKRYNQKFLFYLFTIGIVIAELTTIIHNIIVVF